MRSWDSAAALLPLPLAFDHGFLGHGVILSRGSAVERHVEVLQQRLGLRVGLRGGADDDVDDDDTGGGTPVCRLVTTETPDFVNTGDQAFEDRRRLVSGIPDGFEEPNLDGVGIGPYFPPISNPGACPP